MPQEIGTFKTVCIRVRKNYWQQLSDDTGEKAGTLNALNIIGSKISQTLGKKIYYAIAPVLSKLMLYMQTYS